MLPNKKERFWRRCGSPEKDGRCWYFQAHDRGPRGLTVKKKDYGGSGSYKVRYHRLAWVLFHGKILKGKAVVRTCGDRECVNPDHLTLAQARICLRRYYDDRRKQGAEREMTGAKVAP